MGEGQGLRCEGCALQDGSFSVSRRQDQRGCRGRTEVCGASPEAAGGVILGPLAVSLLFTGEPGYSGVPS